MEINLPDKKDTYDSASAEQFAEGLVIGAIARNKFIQ